MIAITYIGHATTLIEWENTQFLTDPFFSDKVLFLKRKTPLNFDLSQLRDPECVLLSHTHFDHLDLPSFKYISCNVPVIVPKNVGRLLHSLLANPVIELPTGSTWTSPRGFQVTACHARHMGGRYSGVRYTACNAYVIEKGSRAVYFGGDTGYHQDFKAIGQQKNIEVALLPIGATRPRWFMKYRHMNPEEALQASEDLGARTMIPIHWGTLRLSMEPLEEPLEQLNVLIQQKKWHSQVKILPHGTRTVFDPENKVISI